MDGCPDMPTDFGYEAFHEDQAVQMDAELEGQGPGGADDPQGVTNKRAAAPARQQKRRKRQRRGDIKIDDLDEIQIRWRSCCLSGTLHYVLPLAGGVGDGMVATAARLSSTKLLSTTNETLKRHVPLCR